ncbi:uncharacterized protein A1O9_11733 [Exophiala aquamarina CBS 119918]|uniref:Metallo-beta-lactamase domain-containing protein n=1 Tax=Exophiala aquamarina CBS 119918 TaxID=1182545 RepID=A0A072NXF2_9EURO|nr:uncharacterized protein A1O9_11733 [Exophiala aquamarina CBS 119918]KEF52107.1 hypothetical protein A1O9_11733 [Exophiala aquamarina CBS 119918]
MKKGDSLYPPKPLPKLSIPQGASAKVQIIDTTSRIDAPLNLFMQPVIGDFDTVRGTPAFSFLVEQVSSGRKVVFDLGLRKDWHNLPPAVLGLVSAPGWGLQSEKNVAEILQENGVDVAGGAIEAAIWSHWHFDHIGDISCFPESTALISGKGVAEALLPAFPTNPKSFLLESDFSGREHREIDFSDGSEIQLGHFTAVDYFQDGSFYLLNAPGHAIGHICGLARVTSAQEGDAEDTFVFMGGDTAHHGGEFRPSQYLPLPKEIRPSPYKYKSSTPCPGLIFEAIHPGGKGNEPFYHVEGAFHHDTKDAAQSVAYMGEFDAHEDVLVIVAHDATLLDPSIGIEYFPNGTMRDWKAKGYANRLHWAFLQDLVQAVEQ